MQGNLLHSANTGLGKRTSQAPERIDFSKISTAVRIPNLIEIQRESYNRFLQMDFLPEERAALRTLPSSTYRTPSSLLKIGRAHV